MSQGGACTLGEHVSRRNLLRRLMDRMELSKRPVEQVRFRERARLGGKYYIKLLISLRKTAEKENCDQRDEKKKFHTRLVHEEMKTGRTDCGRCKQDRMAHKTTQRSNIVWTNSTDARQPGSTGLFDWLVICLLHSDLTGRGKGGNSVIAPRASADHSPGGIMSVPICWV